MCGVICIRCSDHSSFSSPIPDTFLKPLTWLVPNRWWNKQKALIIYMPYAMLIHTWDDLALCWEASREWQHTCNQSVINLINHLIIINHINQPLHDQSNQSGSVVGVPVCLGLMAYPSSLGGYFYSFFFGVDYWVCVVIFVFVSLAWQLTHFIVENGTRFPSYCPAFGSPWHVSKPVDVAT